MNEHRAAPGDGEPYSTLSVQHYLLDDLVVIAVTGEVDALTAPQLSAAIDEATVGSPAGVVVDLSEVGFLASVGLGLLVTTHEQVTANARFGVVADGPVTRRPITVLGLDSVITLYRTLDEALADMRGA
jgi:anti-sigma B factor antagonist